MPKTVRARITAIAAVVSLVILTLMSAAVVAEHRRVLMENLEETLTAQAAEIAAAFDESQTLIDPGGDDDSVLRISNRAGDQLAASANLASGPGPLPVGSHSRSASFSVVGPVGVDRVDYLILSRVIIGPTGEDLHLDLGSPLDDIADSVRALSTTLAVAVPIVVAGLSALVWLLVGRTLSSVEQIRAEVAAIGPTDLDRRVPAPPGDDEISRLANTMNNMLERISAGARRQRQFIADASHEIRTPLTRMRSELEVDEAHPATADHAATRQSLLAEIKNLQKLASDLLLLAGLDEGTVPPRCEPVDLSALVADEIDAVNADFSADGAAWVNANPDHLRRAVRNLLDNAARFARSGIRVELFQTSEEVGVAVTDDGPGIPPEKQDLIFDRFTRLDESRSTGGAGLGLAIAKHLVESNGGRIEVDPHHTGGTRMVVRLPALRR
ncbi:MAG: sensor histidine kinase [bacterium]